MNWLEHWHDPYVHSRRVRILAEAAARLLPPRLNLLDIGCGDGWLGWTLGQLRPDLSITGVEIAPRAKCRIPVIPFDGRRLPFPDQSFCATLMVDVLHHTEHPGELLREAARVAQDCVVLKDHLREGLGAKTTLSFMDRVGNRRYGIALPFKYLSRREWTRLFADCGLSPEESDSLPDLYPFPANLVFGRDLHFFTRLRRSHGSSLPVAAQP